MPRGLITSGLALGVALAAQTAFAQGGGTASVELKDADGNTVGQVELMQVPNGVHLKADLQNLPAGTHALHIHETGACEPPDFESAGGHFNPTGASHGWLSEGGPHAGDFPNIHVGDDGSLTVEYFSMMVTMDEGENTVFDDDGSAIVIHEGTDDYETDPAGDAGNRIACGVISSGG
ncbi:MAG TPA: superoxide dismutase family protein [Geminicoccaceae bacterium]